MVAAQRRAGGTYCNARGPCVGRVYSNDMLRGGGYAEVRPRRAAASPVQDGRSPASIARCRSFASSRQSPPRAAVQRDDGLVHTLYKAHQAGNRPRRSEPRTPCHVYTATVLHRMRSEKHMVRAIRRTSTVEVFMRFRDANIGYAGTRVLVCCCDQSGVRDIGCL